ncbi:extracellular calcium-sensing receptor-like [Hemitrygon akajei]|uniref:extracellular calcium-sensing receptor-like n=1 Tax=Hemitrygon akajei TaxID=2704970 RepID=UPI003BF95099
MEIGDCRYDLERTAKLDHIGIKKANDLELLERIKLDKLLVPDEMYDRLFFDLMGFRLLQTMIFAIEEINRDEKLLPNVTLGYRIHDDCGSPEIATKAALSMVNGQDETFMDEACDGPLNVPGIVGGAGSSVSIAVARTTGPFTIPLVSYFSTCVCLSDKNQYPTFHRTIPSDEHQSKALMHLVQRFGWTWIGTVHSNDDYGNSGITAFMEAAEDFGLCIAFSESFHRTDPQQKIIKIVQMMKEATTNVVVAFAGPGEMRILFEEVIRQNLSSVQWVGSEAWITTDIVGFDSGWRFLTGAIGTAVPAVDVPGMRDFLQTVHPSSFPDNPLVREFWETTFSCTLNFENATKTIGTVGWISQCSLNESLRHIVNAYTDLTMDGSSYIVYKALLHYMKSIYFTTKTGEKVHLDKNGNPTAAYDIVNWQMNGNGSLVVRKVGYYNGSAPPGKELVLKPHHITWSSGQRESVLKVASQEQGKQPGEDSQFVVLTARTVPMEKLATPQTPLNASSVLFYSGPMIGEINASRRVSSTWLLPKCSARCWWFLLWLDVLVKTILVLTAFKATHPSSNRMKWFGQRQQRISVFLLVSVQGLVCALWLLIAPPFPVINTKYYRERIILECDKGSSAAFYSASGYIALLSCICFVLAFLARKLPDNFNEAKCITFSMLIFCAVWVTYIPASVSSPGKYTVAVEVFAILASSFGLLFCIFAPKCYVIIVTPEKNTKKHIMGKVISEES